MGQPARNLAVKSLSPLQEMSSPYTAWCWAANFAHVIIVHQEQSLQEKRRVLAHDQQTPFAIHPIWCAAAILSTHDIQEDLRVTGYLVLLHHDLEARTGEKPKVSSLIREQIRAMACLSRVKDSDGAIAWSAPAEIRLFRLFEQVHKLYIDDPDNNSLERELTRDLIADVEQHFGNLKIVRMAKALLIE